MTWTVLSQGDGPIQLVPGRAYAVIASVKATHAKADIQNAVSLYGLRLNDYAEQGQRAGFGPDPKSPDYRYVALAATATRVASVPWSAPWPASVIDSSHIVSAWEDAAPSSAALKPKQDDDDTSVLLISGAIALALIGGAWCLSSMRSPKSNPSLTGSGSRANGDSLIAKGRSCLFEMVDGREVHVRGGMLHDPSGRWWPSRSVLCGPFQARIRRATPDEYRGAAKHYLGSSHKAFVGSVDTPPRKLSDWRSLGEVDRIFYTRTGRKGPGRYVHKFNKPTAVAVVVKGKRKVRLYSRGSYCRLELPTGAILDTRGFVFP